MAEHTEMTETAPPKRRPVKPSNARMVQRERRQEELKFIEEIRSWQSDAKTPDKSTPDKPETAFTTRDTGVFAANLDRLMTRQGIRNSALAQTVGVSREMVSVWRQGKSLPAPERGEVLARALKCTETELFQEVEDELPPMLPIAQWAKREGIPVGRAKSLFELGILDGDVGGGEGMHLVPVQLRAPPDSKHLVRVSRRPGWVAAFAVNLDQRMREMMMNNEEMGKATGVGQCAVTHWRSGRGYPLQERLPLIAKKLGCEVDELLADPLHRRMTQWKFRFGHAWLSPGIEIPDPPATPLPVPQVA